MPMSMEESTKIDKQRNEHHMFSVSVKHFRCRHNRGLGHVFGISSTGKSSPLSCLHWKFDAVQDLKRTVKRLAQKPVQLHGCDVRIRSWLSLPAGTMRRLDTLGLRSLSPSILASFAAHGILSVEDFLLAENTPKFEEIGTEAQEQAILDIVDYLEQQSWGFRTSARMLQELQARGERCLPTGCESLDELLEGGLREGTVTELVGGSSSGKTQVCMQVAATATYRCQAMVGYVDTCHSFSVTRLSHMLGGLVGGRDAGQRRAGAANEIGEAMKSVMHFSIFDVFSMISLLNQIHVNLSAQVQCGEQAKVMRLLIVDCASSVIAPILGGTQGHALMVSMGVILKKLALENHLAVLITNHTVGGEGGQPKPALGETWKAMPNVRLLLVRDWSSNICHVSVMKHSTMACNRQTAFRITRTGLKPAF